MPLPEPAPRRHRHTRSVHYHGYQRDDGLWDIEGELVDTKPFSFIGNDGQDFRAGEPIHLMRVRVTIDDQMVVRAIATAMEHTPHGECQQGVDPMQQMVGARLGPGWRQSIEKALGGVRGCTHLRELLFNLATAAYQAAFPAAREAGDEQPPYHLGRCIAWDTSGAVTARLYPQFVNWQKTRTTPPSST